MAHSAQPPPPPRRRLEIIVGSVLLVVGLVAVIVAVVALRHPKGREAGVADTSTAPRTGSVSTSSTAGTGPPTSTAPPSTVGPTSSAPTVSTAPPSTAAVSTPPPVSSAISTAPAVANRLPLIVLNNTTNASVTTTALSQFRTGGWTATDGGSFDGQIISTAAYYDPAADGSRAAALALQSQFPSIKRVVARFAGLPAGPVVVVLTTDYS